MKSLVRRAAAAALLGGSSLLGGCELEDLVGGTGDGRTDVLLFVGHHTSAENGEYPDRGGAGQARVFQTDTGWTVKLAQGFVVLRAASLQHCDGDEHAFEFFDGPVVEDLLAGDLEVFSAGITEVQPGSYCGLRVHYGALDEDDSDESDGSDPETRSAAGRTVSLRIGAERDGHTTPYDIETDESFEVELSFDEPLRLRGDEPFPAELTVWKAYDRFFDGMDFASRGSTEAVEHELAGRLAETLGEQTSVSQGTSAPVIDD